MTNSQGTESVNDKLLAPGVSVVLCCHNSADVIVPTVRALAAQPVPSGSGYEVVLVDNNCSDGTVSLAQEAWNGGRAKNPLRIVKESAPGLIHARKKGVSHARYDILLFVDDDNVLARGGVSTLLSLYRRHPQAAGIGGRIEPLFQGDKPAWFDQFAGVFACTPPGQEADLPAVRRSMKGAGLSFRTRGLLSLFHSSLPLFLVGRKGEALSRGEDSEICLRLCLQGGELRYEPSFRLQHFLKKDRLNWDYVLRARRWYGKADVLLKIYKELVDGHAPLPFGIRRQQAERQIEKLQATAGDARSFSDEGSRHALTYNYFLGLLEGLLELGEVRFEAMRESIVNFYAKSLDVK